MSRQMLNEETWTSPEIRAAYPAARARRTMSVPGVIGKTLVLLVITAVLAGIGWNNADLFLGRNAGLVYLLWFMLLIGMTIVAMRNPRIIVVMALLYAVFNGMWIGAISRYYESAFDGIVGLALLGTLATAFAVLFLYLLPGFRVTQRMVQVIGAMTLGVALLYFVSWIIAIFGGDLDWLYGSSAGAIALGLLIVGIAASNLLVDFTFIEQGVRQGMPKQLEWFAAFGLVSTLVWLYLEILRLLARVAAARQQ